MKSINLKICPELIKYLEDAKKAGLDKGYESELAIVRNYESKEIESSWCATIIDADTADDIRKKYGHSCNVLVEGKRFFLCPFERAEELDRKMLKFDDAGFRLVDD